jgi:hypothetical protein
MNGLKSETSKLENLSMSEATPFREAPPQSEATDLSAEIIQSIEREFGERVTCRRISGSKYRCNWWSPHSPTGYDNPGMYGLLVTTHVVKRSRFLTIHSTPEGLVIVHSAGDRGKPLKFSKSAGSSRQTTASPASHV